MRTTILALIALCAVAWIVSPSPSRGAAPTEAPAAGELRLHGTLELDDALASDEVARHLRLLVRPADAPLELVATLAWRRMTDSGGSSTAPIRLFESKPLPPGPYVMELAPLGYRFEVQLDAGASPLRLEAGPPARTLIDARDELGDRVPLSSCRAYAIGSAGEPTPVLARERPDGDAEVLSRAGRLRIELPDGWWPRSRVVEVLDGWNYLELELRRAVDVRLLFTQEGEAARRPPSWWKRVTLDPLDPENELLSRGLAGLAAGGASGLRLELAAPGELRISLPQWGDVGPRVHVVEVAPANDAGRHPLVIALDG